MKLFLGTELWEGIRGVMAFVLRVSFRFVFIVVSYKSDLCTKRKSWIPTAISSIILVDGRWEIKVFFVAEGMNFHLGIPLISENKWRCKYSNLPSEWAPRDKKSHRSKVDT